MQLDYEDKPHLLVLYVIAVQSLLWETRAYSPRKALGRNLTS